MIVLPGYDADRGWIEFDPRSRIIAFVLFGVGTCGVYDWRVLLGLIALSALMIIPTGMKPREIAVRLMPVNTFMVFIWLTMPLLAGGPHTRLFDVFDVSVPGVRQALSITLKANSLVLAATALLYPVEFGSLALGFHRLGAPTKLVWLFILSYRYVLGLTDKVVKCYTAIRLRSAGRNKRRFQAFGGLFAKLFVSGHYSGERLYIAMRARGYGERFTLAREMIWRSRDSALVACMAMVAATAIYLGITL